MSQLDPVRARVRSPREMLRSRPGAGQLPVVRRQAADYASDQMARAGGRRVRPVVVPANIPEGLRHWTAPEDGSIAWHNEEQHSQGLRCRWDSWEWWATLFPAVHFRYAWVTPVPDQVGLTVSANTNVWGEFWEQFATDNLYATEAEAFAALDALGYTENQFSYGGPDGIALWGAQGEWHRYHLRRWNDGTLRYRFSDPSSDATVVIELVDAGGARLRKATRHCYFSQLVEITQSFPSGDAGEIRELVATATPGAGAAAVDFLVGGGTPDLDCAWGVPDWAESYREYWEPVAGGDSYHEQISHDGDGDWAIDNAAGPCSMVCGLRITGQGIISDQLVVSASLYLAEDIRACG